MSFIFQGDETLVWQTIRTRLAQERKRKGLSLRQLAALVGIDYSLVFRVEQGTRRVSLRVLDTWCEALGLPKYQVRSELLLADLDASEVEQFISYCQNHKESA
jgi:transcriptional regulator with XRE-family HTH domain